MARGDGRIFLRGNVWWISYYGPSETEPGRRVEFREPGGGSEEAARKYLRRRIREVGAALIGARRFYGPKLERLTMLELFANYEKNAQVSSLKSLPAIRSRLKELRIAFWTDHVMNVDRPRLVQYIEKRQADGAKPASINRSTEIIGASFKLAVKSGLLPSAPSIPSLREDNAWTGFFEKPEYDRLLTHLPTHLQDIVTFAYYTGWRRGEILGLEWRDVDRAAHVIRLRTSKTGRGRTLALTGELAQLIERRWPARVVEDQQGNQRVVALVFHNGGKVIVDFRRSWRRACAAAGVSGRRFHDLRRTAVRNLIRSGVPERVAMDVTGHTTRSVFDRYNITSEKDLRAALDKVQAHLSAQPVAPATVVPLRPAKEGRS